MRNIKSKILLNRWKLENGLKIVLFVQIIINLCSFNYPKWLTLLLPFITLIELSLLLLFYFEITKIETAILQNLDIEVLEEYISKIETCHFSGKSQNIYLFKLSNYYYIFGQFEKSIELLKMVDFEKLPSGSYSALDYYFQAYFIRIKMKSWDKLENIKDHFLSYQSNKVSEYKKKQSYMTYIEIFDTLFIQNNVISNFVLPENNLYEYIRNRYLYAINALNRGDKMLAREEFQKIVTYSDKLYMVREAQEWLNNN
ncbi:TPA: hypothetical protein ACGO7A_001199 [Streptococcus suis]